MSRIRKRDNYANDMAEFLINRIEKDKDDLYYQYFTYFIVKNVEIQKRY